jgi:hypothetical protein
MITLLSPRVLVLYHFQPIPIRPLLTNLTHRFSYPRVLTTATGAHIMSSAVDLESGQRAQAAPRAGVF